MNAARRAVLLVAFVIAVVGPATASAHNHDGSHADPAAHHSLRQPVTDQNFYFVMADRFDNGDPANDNGDLPPGTGAGQSGFDPTGKGWYHGGDLKGLRAKLDYIKGLGTTALWLTPSFKNKAVQPEDRSAGYHGYWITDFTRIDPHLGTNADLRALVDAAHALGSGLLRVITNHTATWSSARRAAGCRTRRRTVAVPHGAGRLTTVTCSSHCCSPTDSRRARQPVQQFPVYPVPDAG
jgi:hypothetical protein